MKLAAWAERLMGMNDVVWARHANPWSGWTRMATGLPLFSLAVWSRVWLGWGAVLAVAVALAWIWFNPRAFAPPDNIDNWMSKGVYGERIYLEHKAELPAHHQRSLGAGVADVAGHCHHDMGPLGFVVGRGGVWHGFGHAAQDLVRRPDGMDI